ncbi:relaxase/mobilization nuclease domain-containing protein [Paraprevotella clara]|uniref:Relaxase/mobilization nuclease domain protein n=1 Tax=Paraprevotella clara YIT 11840 TaxID=762968 RepID=G5ST02_9BACT|nr:relaxase/mobilization nuclease domain-containing protein [Paraprevotella clara]EHG99789.1 relaxase/mobilization nuclease domain protein [Paraprevotella clara YIT 11840]
MIGKIKKGKSFGGCIRYVMGKDNAEIIASDGVLLGNTREITDSFNYQRMLNPKIKQPVGHIALSFKPEDKPKLTNEFMAEIAMEYMDLMGIKNTQFILVRHNNTDNPHCHLVYNRIGYDGKVISSQSDYKRNEIATKKLKDKYGLTYAEDKSKTNVEKLRSTEQVKYEIHNAVKNALRHSKTWKQFNERLAEQGVKLEFVKRSREIKSVNDIQGIRFTKDGLTFKASQISRDFSFAKLNAQLSWNTSETEYSLDSKKQRQEQPTYNLPNNNIIESNGLGLLSSFGESSSEEQIPYDELLRRRKKKKRKGLGL